SVLHLHEFRERAAPVAAEHRFLPAFVPLVPRWGGAFGRDQVGPPGESPVATMPANENGRNAPVVAGRLVPFAARDFADSQHVDRLLFGVGLLPLSGGGGVI